MFSFSHKKESSSCKSHTDFNYVLLGRGGMVGEIGGGDKEVNKPPGIK